METFSALLAICAENSPVSGEFPSQRPVRRSFDVFFDLRLNKRLSKLSWGWWFETLPCPLWRHSNPCLGWWLAARSAQSHNLNQCWLLFNPTEISPLKFEWKYKICISTKWAGKCLLNVTRSEITHNSTNCLITCLSLPKRIHRLSALPHWHLVSGVRRSLCEGGPSVTMGSPHKRLVMRKWFPCYDVTIKGRDAGIVTGLIYTTRERRGFHIPPC